MTADLDRHAPRWHVRAPHGWLNDPNGVGRWGGRWHVMYQWNPHAPVWGDIHWGHASSPDLLRWDHEPTALAPRPGTIDAGGAWSGVAVHDDGDVALLYSAVRDREPSAGVAVARRGPDGTWVQPDRLAAPHPDAPGVVDVRDPFVLTVDGRRLGVQGAGVDGRGAVLVYDVADLDDWRPLGTLLTADEAGDRAGAEQPGEVWECPQLVRVGDAWVLLVSWFERAHGPERFGVTAFTGRLDVSGEAPRFVVEHAAPLDAGPDLYAPQAYVADDGRVLVWGWSWEGRGAAHAERPAHEVAAAGWAGVLTCPRELVLTPDGTAVTCPVAELAGLRGGALTLVDGVLGTDEPAFRVAASGPVVVSLVDGADEVRVWASDGPAEVLVDGSLVEAFEPARSTTLRVYPRGAQRWRVRASGDAEAHVLRVPGEDASAVD